MFGLTEMQRMVVLEFGPWGTCMFFINFLCGRDQVAQQYSPSSAGLFVRGEIFLILKLVLFNNTILVLFVPHAHKMTIVFLHNLRCGFNNKILIKCSYLGKLYPCQSGRDTTVLEGM